MKNIWKILGFGILTWLIPFIVSFPVYSRGGELLIGEGLFKSLMVVIGALVGVFLLVFFFKKIAKDYVKRGIRLGIVWLIINIALDFLTLVMMYHIPVEEYLTWVGLRYLSILIMAIGMGYTLQQHSTK